MEVTRFNLDGSLGSTGISTSMTAHCINAAFALIHRAIQVSRTIVCSFGEFYLTLVGG